MTILLRTLFVASSWIGVCACQSAGSATRAEPLPHVSSAPLQNPPAGPKLASVSPKPEKPAASLGGAAPGFDLPDVDGKLVSLAQFKGKTIVLEWFNPECPFVRNSHIKGSLVNTAEKHSQAGVVWLAVNSSGAGRQGHGVEQNRAARVTYKLSHPILLDEDGRVGRLYGAKRTPHMFVIAPTGELVYRGAIDNSPDGEGESAEGGKLVNYVEEALAALKAGKKPKVAETDAYGCGVKYAN